MLENLAQNTIKSDAIDRLADALAEIGKKMAEELGFMDENLLADWHVEAERTGIWYHYSSADALLSIIHDNQVVLWASHSGFVNDKMEIKAGVQLVTQFLSEIHGDDDGSVWSDILAKEQYLVCFSKAKDCIPMWNTYAKNGNGLAIGFDPAGIEEALSVIYSDSIEEDDWKAKLKELTDGKMPMEKFARFLLLILFMPMLYKDAAFSYEKEIRLIAPPEAEVKFRTRNGVIIPYKEIILPATCIKEIIIGPTADFEKQKKGLEMFLKSKGLKNVEIVQSKVPLQGYA